MPDGLSQAEIMPNGLKDARGFASLFFNITGCNSLMAAFLLLSEPPLVSLSEKLFFFRLLFFFYLPEYNLLQL